MVDAARLEACGRSKEESQVTDNNELHVAVGTGPVGIAVMDELASRSKRVRMVNRGSRANVPEGAEVVGGDATDPAFTREVSVGASTSYNALNPPYNKWPKLFPRYKPACWRERRRPERSSLRWRTSTCTDPQVASH